MNNKRVDRSGKAWCRHFDGIQNKVCKAGISYESVRAPQIEGKPFEWPCHGRCDGCVKYDSFTQEEIKKQDDDIERVIAGITVARPAIVAECARHGFIQDVRGGRKGKGVSGNLECPVCNLGILSYSRAAYNGHVHARCSTEGCVSWME